VGLKLVKLINICLEKNIPFVCFRFPHDKNVYLWLQASGKIIFVENIREIINKHGFVYAPFHRQTNFPIVLFEPEIIIKNNDIPDSLISKITKQPVFYKEFEIAEPREASREEYLQQASGIITTFRKDIKKAVLSRIHLEKKKADFNTGNFFIRMLESYPEVFCHLINIPGAGTWAGATPETLLKTDINKCQTISLAGTQPKIGKEKEVVWKAKEMEEQRFVSNYIIEVLKRFGINDFQIEGPQTIQAGKALHLSTKFIFDKSFIQDRLADFIENLNPTPAVCGLPKEKALELILRTEKHNREYYAGYCGPVNMNGKTDLYVNLRCMKILKDKLALYVGGGLTAKSVPEKEWAETELKAQTLLSVIEFS
jgi:isochorismate synthase